MPVAGVHIDAESKLKKFPSTELRIASNLSKIWYITSAKSHSAAGPQNNYFSLALQPTDELYKRFNFSGEIVCVICPYGAFDGRTIDAAESMLKEKENRYDQNHLVVVARDSHVARKVAEINQREAGKRILIPFTYEELLGEREVAQKNTVQRLSELLYVRDVFAFDSPLRRDEDLFGREEDIQILHGKYANGENGCLFGLRRIGKTSVLLAVQRRVQKNGALAMYVDCSSPTIHQSRWNEVLFEIIRKLASENGFKKGFAQRGHYTSQRAPSSFESDLKDLFSASSKRRLLIILDEIENISFDLSLSEHWSSGRDYLLLWQTLRSTYQQNPNLFSIIVAGVNPRIVETPRVGNDKENPIFGSFTPNYLSLFNATRVQEMVNGIGRWIGLSFDLEASAALTKEFGGHPFLIRQVCSRLHRQMAATGTPRPQEIGLFAFKNNHSQLLQGVKTYLKSILEVLASKYPEEHDLLSTLACGDEESFGNFALESHVWIEHLLGYGLIVLLDGKYHFRIEAVKQLLVETEKRVNMNAPLSQRWAVLSDRRNTFEAWLRAFVRSNLKRKYGQLKGKERFIESVHKKPQREKLLALEYDHIFKSEIYLSDLKNAVLKDWDEFRMVFKDDRPRFELFIEEMNRYRADAHAKTITAEQYASALAAIEWLHARMFEFVGSGE